MLATKLKNTYKKLIHYFSIFTIILGTTFGLCTSTSVLAASYTLKENSTNATDGINDATDDDDFANGDNINVADFIFVINGDDGTATAITAGAITGTADDGTPELEINLLENDALISQTVTIGSVSFTADADTAGLIDINNAIADGVSGTIVFTGNVDTGTYGSTYGIIDIDVADSTATTPLLTVQFGGDVTATTNVNQGAELAKLVYNGTGDQTITGAINSDGGADGEVTLDVTKTGGTATFESAIGTATNGRLLLLDVTTAASTAVFNGAVEAVTVVNTGTATFGSTVTGTTFTLDTGSTTTFTGKATATTLAVNGTATAYIGFGHATAANAIATVDLSSTSTLIIQDTVTNGMIVFNTTNLDGTTSGGDVATGSKIYMPVNLSNGQTLVLFSDTDDGGDVDDAVNAALQNNALITYNAVEDADNEDVTVTATEVAQGTVETNLSVTANNAKALSQAYAAAINDTNVDATAEDAFGNALNALGGYSATEDTALAKQVAPQDDMISGSTLASKAVTGTVQGIISNRMASLRSGDAYYGMGMSAGNMTAKSGFIQAFGSEVEQKNKTVGSGIQYGYESSSVGFALGFDGTTDTGATVGLSFSMSNTDLDGKGTGKAKNDIDSYTASLYWDKTGQNGYVEGSLTYGLNENKTSRLVNTAGLSRTYTGSYDSNQLSLSLGGGAPNAVGASGYVTPFIGVTGTYIKTDAYTETSNTSGDNLRLRVAQDDVNSLVGKVGVKYHNVTDKGTPMISLSLNNEFGDDTINSTNTYQGGGSSFTTSTDVEPLSATLGLGYSYGSDTASIEFAYEAEANDDKYLGHYGSIKIVGKF